MIRAAGVGVAALAVGLTLAYQPSLAEPPRPDAAAGAVAGVPAAALAGAVSASPAQAPTGSPTGTPPKSSARSRATLPLAGLRIALDPGHQLGNHRFPAQIRRPVPAGGFTKPCNTTGTSTDAGYPEATLNFAIATEVVRRLRALGATVLLTRTSNSERLWGPCVDKRGEFGRNVGAALEVSLHGDGARASGRGFHVIAPVSRRPWTNDIAAASLRLATALRTGLDRAGLPRSTYLAGGTALVRRSDLGTLNMSDVPIAMIEVGNMRNASDARRMTSASGRAVYASGVVRGIRLYLRR